MFSKTGVVKAITSSTIEELLADHINTEDAPNSAGFFECDGITLRIGKNIDGDYIIAEEFIEW